MVRRSKLEKPNTHFWLFNSLILIFYFFANEAQAATGPNRSLKLQNEVHFLRFSKVIFGRIKHSDGNAALILCPPYPLPIFFHKNEKKNLGSHLEVAC